MSTRRFVIGWGSLYLAAVLLIGEHMSTSTRHDVQLVLIGVFVGLMVAMVLIAVWTDRHSPADQQQPDERPERHP